MWYFIVPLPLRILPEEDTIPVRLGSGTSLLKREANLLPVAMCLPSALKGEGVRECLYSQE